MSADACVRVCVSACACACACAYARVCVAYASRTRAPSPQRLPSKHLDTPLLLRGCLLSEQLLYILRPSALSDQPLLEPCTLTYRGLVLALNPINLLLKPLLWFQRGPLAVSSSTSTDRCLVGTEAALGPGGAFKDFNEASDCSIALGLLRERAVAPMRRGVGSTALTATPASTARRQHRRHGPASCCQCDGAPHAVEGRGGAS